MSSAFAAFSCCPSLFLTKFCCMSCISSQSRLSSVPPRTSTFQFNINKSWLVTLKSPHCLMFQRPECWTRSPWGCGGSLCQLQLPDDRCESRKPDGPREETAGVIHVLRPQHGGQGGRSTSARTPHKVTIILIRNCVGIK